MKQDDACLHRMIAPHSGPTPGTVSPDYLELRLALSAGEKDLQLRRRSTVTKSSLLSVQDNQPPRLLKQQHRTHSCKYPAGSRRVIQSQRTRNGSPGGERDREERDHRDPGSGSPRSLSAPQSRSSSWKKMRRPRDLRHFREVYGGAVEGERGERMTSGVGGESLEDTIISKLHELKLIQDEDCFVVRSFSTSPRGLINRGDSFKRKSDIVVSLPVASSDDVILLPAPRPTHRSVSLVRDPVTRTTTRRRNDVIVQPTCSVSGVSLTSYTVLVMGDHGVGKTALLQQFMTSEFMAAIETSFDMECEKTVSVLLDGEETILNFVDLPISVQKECVQYSEIEAYLITYSITERESFQYAANILQELKRQGRTDAAIILVANKNDLVRSRQVTEEEGKSLCKRMNCKYIEVSAALNHRVDDLLVGLVQQIRLNPRRLVVQSSEAGLGPSEATAPGQAKHSGCLNAALNFIIELIRNRRSTSRSCENLWVL